MVAGNRQITHEESLPGGQSIDPRENAADGRWLIDAETRFALAAYVAVVFQGLIAAIADDRVHAEVHESAGMKQPGSITGIGQNLRDSGGRHSLIVLWLTIQSRPGRALDRKETANGLRVSRVGIFKKQAPASQGREVGHRIFAGPIRLKVLSAGRLQMDHKNVSSRSSTAEPG